MGFVKASMTYDSCESMRYDDQSSSQSSHEGKDGIGYQRPESSKPSWLKNRLDKDKAKAGSKSHVQNQPRRNFRKAKSGWKKNQPRRDPVGQNVKSKLHRSHNFAQTFVDPNTGKTVKDNRYKAAAETTLWRLAPTSFTRKPALQTVGSGRSSIRSTTGINLPPSIYTRISDGVFHGCNLLVAVIETSPITRQTDGGGAAEATAMGGVRAISDGVFHGCNLLVAVIETSPITRQTDGGGAAEALRWAASVPASLHDLCSSLESTSLEESYDDVPQRQSADGEQPAVVITHKNVQQDMTCNPAVIDLTNMDQPQDQCPTSTPAVGNEAIKDQDAAQLEVAPAGSTHLSISESPAGQPAARNYQSALGPTLYNQSRVLLNWQLPCWRLGAWLRPVSRGNRHFTVGGGRLRQSGPRPEGILLRQPALEGLTRSARTETPRKVGRNKFRRGAAAAAIWERREACAFRVRVKCNQESNSIGYPRMSASGESSTTMHRLLHASGSHPIPPSNDPKTNQYNQDLGLIHSTNGNHLESPNEGSSIDHQVTIYLHAQNHNVPYQ
ncbi:hypothetical protein F511_09856 [Dorcoceras hygrometricum]|uniref:Uncharacterized protein n=1 Tax=Dorcoceras hygrometricum TaxID=472368 RepID=A0A2Z7CDQ5_9LAMI|nr:hypothetical protein F511_09856 [Dorcoceras hygrometricum]